MIVEQQHWTERDGWYFTSKDSKLGANAQLLLVFGGRSTLSNDFWLAHLQSQYAHAHIVSCSTSGEIADVEVHDQSVVATAIQFEKTEIQLAQVAIGNEGSLDAAKRLASQLPLDGLKHVIVLSDGLHVNGTELIAGLHLVLPEKVTITGGLAGDGAKFEKTLVGVNGLPTEKQIVAIGLYGSEIKIGYGSVGGWDAFGPDRMITKSEANVLYELDGKPALDLYKNYLGDKAAALPASALLFPLAIRKSMEDQDEVVRTILSVDENNQTMTFAGDMPVGHVARLMKANFDRLIDGAQHAASQSLLLVEDMKPELALLVSCVGRKLVLGQRIEDEVEGVREIVGNKAIMAGFYSYGELAPGNNRFDCRLHNQTMTITLFSEQ